MEIQFAEGKDIYIERTPIDTIPLMMVKQQVYAASDTHLISKLVGNNYHLTWFNFGEPNDLYKAFHKRSPSLDRNRFLESFKDLLVRIYQMRGDELEADGEKLGLFGSKKDLLLLALKLRRSQQMMSDRRRAVDVIVDWIRSCGVDDPYTLMRNHTVLKYHLEDTYNPHITLAHLRRREIPQVCLPETTFTLNPPTLANIIIKEDINESVAANPQTPHPQV